MHKKTVTIPYYEYDAPDTLDETAAQLIQAAIDIAGKAYAPYSHFPVGAAVLLDNGAVYAGNNQENIAYPSGTCAERSVLNYVHGNFPDHHITDIAITALHSDAHTPVTPCGFCRQVIVELERHQGTPIRVILHKIGGPTYVFDSAVALLPLAFEDASLKLRKKG